MRRKLGRVYADGTNDSKASHQLIEHKGARACIPPRKNAGLWRKGLQRNSSCKGKGWRTGRGYRVSPSLVGGDSDVPVQTVDGRKNHTTKIQGPGRRSDGVCKRDKQTEYSGSTCQKASSVAVTWGWGSCAHTADLGNNACPDTSSRLWKTTARNSLSDTT